MPSPPPPTKIVAVHVNYRSRAAERGATPSYPSYFLKPPSTISGDGATVERPQGCELLAYEGEIALVIGRTTRRVDAAEAWSCVSHVAAANDLGVYDLRYADRGSNVHSKGWDGCTPLGPPADGGGAGPRGTPHRHPGERRRRAGGSDRRAALLAPGPGGRRLEHHDPRSGRPPADGHAGRLAADRAGGRGRGRAERPLGRALLRAHDDRHVGRAPVGHRSGAQGDGGRPGRGARRHRTPPDRADRRAAAGLVERVDRHAHQSAAAPRHPLDVLHGPAASPDGSPAPRATPTRCAMSPSARTCSIVCRPG